MARLRVIDGRRMVSFLQRQGFQRLRSKGSHVRLAHPDGRRTTVPIHPGKLLPRGTILAVLRDCDVPRELYDAEA